MKASFENASIADAITRASIVAPTKGTAFEKSPGILIEIEEDGATAVSSTDCMVFFKTWSQALETDSSFALLLPSVLLANIASTLPIGSGKSVTFEVRAHGRGKRLLVSSGKIKAYLNILLSDTFPRWGAFDPDCMTVVSPIGSALKAVEWATADPGDGAFSGVHLADGRAIGTNRYRAASINCNLGPIEEVTIPAGEVVKLLKQSGECRFGLIDGMVCFMPDEATQLMATVIDAKYPNVSKAFTDNQTDSFVCSKSELLELLTQMNSFQSGTSRTPRLELRLDGEKLTVLSSAGDAGAIANYIDIEASEAHDEKSFFFSPNVLLPCVQNSHGDKVTVFYHSEISNGTWRIVGDNTYSSWCKPLKTSGE